jgi:hypothetical protein
MGCSTPRSRIEQPGNPPARGDGVKDVQLSAALPLVIAEIAWSEPLFRLALLRPATATET